MFYIHKFYFSDKRWLKKKTKKYDNDLTTSYKMFSVKNASCITELVRRIQSGQFLLSSCFRTAFGYNARLLAPREKFFKMGF